MLARSEGALQPGDGWRLRTHTLDLKIPGQVIGTVISHRGMIDQTRGAAEKLDQRQQISVDNLANTRSFQLPEGWLSSPNWSDDFEDKSTAAS